MEWETDKSMICMCLTIILILTIELFRFLNGQLKIVQFDIEISENLKKVFNWFVATYIPKWKFEKRATCTSLLMAGIIKTLSIYTALS